MLEQISTLNTKSLSDGTRTAVMFREMLISGKELKCLFGHSEDSEILGCMAD